MSQKEPKYLDSPAIGIDLGTIYSCVGVWNDSMGRAEIIPNDQGNNITPSYVAFTDKEKLVGEAAFNQYLTNPENTIFDVKRFIGQKFNSPQVEKEMKNWPFKLESGPNHKLLITATIKGETKKFTPEEISSLVLSKLKQNAEKYLNKPIKDAVIAVPAFFNDEQRQATKDAGTKAGLNVIRIINEPTAAAMGYGYGAKIKIKGEKKVLIFDMGGGTFNASVLAISGGLFEVKATGGDPHLGGEAFTSKLVDYCAADFAMRNEVDISENATALRKLRAECEKAKRILSSTSQTTIEVNSLYQDMDYICMISRAKFEEICLPLFQSTFSIVEKVLKESHFSKQQIHEIVLVGGATRTPKLSELLTDYFELPEPKHTVNPEEVVACGAAIEAAIIVGQISIPVEEQLKEMKKAFNLIDKMEQREGTIHKESSEAEVKKGTFVQPEA